MKFLKVFFLFAFAISFAQKGFEISDRKKTVIPFQLINNLIFIPLNINGVELTFLLDSGVNETLLFSLENKEVNFNDIEKVKFSGLGESQDIEGLRSDNNMVKIGADYEDTKHTVFIILDEDINFSSHVGIPVNGIIGYQFFKNYPVQIDYITKRITIFNDDLLLRKRTKRFQEFPITIEENKPYIIAAVEQSDQKLDSKMLLDLGNSDAVWLFPELIDSFTTNRVSFYDYLGQGFNGDIFGKRSRIRRIHLGDFKFEKPLVAMPDSYSIRNLKLVPDRKGSVGSEILRRFTVIFNYPENKVYLKTNRHFRDLFLINKSGLDVQHDGMKWESDLVRVVTRTSTPESGGISVYNAEEGFRYNFVLTPRYSIAGCRKDSPCDVAGLRKDDKIISINKRPARDFTLQRINDLFKQPDGSQLRFVVDRAGQTLQFDVKLTDPIPYQDEN